MSNKLDETNPLVKIVDEEPINVSLKPQNVSNASRRVQSVDYLRGLTMAYMLLVDFPGDPQTVFWPLDHADFDGFTPTDLVFPLFLFVMGISIPIAFSKFNPVQFSSKTRFGHYCSVLLVPRVQLWIKICRRTVILLLIGLFLNAIPFWHLEHWSHFRFSGILQRIGVVYFIVASLSTIPTGFLPKVLRYRYFFVYLGGLIFALLWLAVTFLIPSVNAETGYLCPFFVKALTKECCIEGLIDRYILSFGSTQHLYADYWDPEGILSTLTASCTCIIGFATGSFFLQAIVQVRSASNNSNSASIFAYFVAFSMPIYFLMTFFAWVFSLLMPLNKNLYTLSYMFFVSGFSGLCLLFSVCLVDIMLRQLVRKYDDRGPFLLRMVMWTVKPFIYLGMNCLMAFVGASLSTRLLLAFKVIRPRFLDRFETVLEAGDRWTSLYHLIYLFFFRCWIHNGYLASFIFGICVVVIWLIITTICYKRRWFLKI